MKKTFLLLFALGLPLVAGPIIQFDPANGAITGTPGGTTGWGFAIQSDPTNWISFVGSFLINETNPALGVYTDFIGASGGPVDFALPAAAPSWTQAFSVADQTGIGMYELLPSAPTGETNHATLRLQWTEYTADPFSCGSCFAGSFYQDFDVRIRVEGGAPQNVPEPATGFIVLAALAILSRRVC